jgi:hypothetical protein
LHSIIERFQEDKGGGWQWAVAATVDVAHDGKGSATREREVVMQQPAGARETQREGLHNGKGGGMMREVAMQQPAGMSEAWPNKRGGGTMREEVATREGGVTR